MNELSRDPPQPNPIEGELITETFDYDHGRQVTVYLPTVSPEVIVFAGDGQMIAQWGGLKQRMCRPP